ncbi:MAG: quinol:cytochrome C oxidoreductase [Planctomycetes bacterium]|nr:quinol:cytochrome C oxidoreductase [Planctomycetota bacterium]
MREDASHAPNAAEPAHPADPDPSADPAPSADARRTAAFAPGPAGKWISLALIALGAVLSLCAVWRKDDSVRLAFAYLWGFSFVWTLVAGSLFFVALHHATRAVWSVVVRRVAELFAAPAPLVAILAVPLFCFSLAPQRFSIYPWADPATVRGDHVLEGKALYLNPGFFIARGVLFVAVWALFSRFFVGRSLRQDRGEAGEEATIQMRRWSPAFLLLFALTVTFASFDWLMSLEPHWFSTIYGVYVFSGMVPAALGAITLAAIWLRRQGRLGDGVVTRHHLYNLGALQFAFACFWAYIAFSQFLLIWYGNLPEETIYFIRRAENGWLGISLALVALRFAAPFFLLLSRRAKMDPRILAIASVIGLAGQMLDLYWLIMPAVHGGGPRLSWQEAGPLLLCCGLLILALWRFLGKHSTLAAGDPLFETSRRFRL